MRLSPLLPIDLSTVPAPQGAGTVTDPSEFFMTVSTAQTLADVKKPFNWMAAISWVVLFSLLGWGWDAAEINPLVLIADSGNMAEFAADFFPPDFSDIGLYLEEMVITLHIALWGTVLSIILSVPFGILSAENLMPVWVYQPVRRLMDATRAINEMVFAMLFVVAVGLGPFAGVLALFIHTTGVLAKLFSEAVEAIDPRPVEGVRATGANMLEEILYGVIPQVLPLWISYSLYRFESNARSATVVGMVGAGGIGVILWESMRGFQFQQTCAVMIVIIISVTLTDLLSQRLRKAFI
jgi:phosphonate ABC transporter, permease protein PhnE